MIKKNHMCIKGKVMRSHYGHCDALHISIAAIKQSFNETLDFVRLLVWQLSAHRSFDHGQCCQHLVSINCLLC